jgi:dihydrofolate synthase / folylpolyglutamate synthase
LRDHTTLIKGGLPPEANAVVEREVESRHATSRWAVSVANNIVPGYQGRNLALAQAATGEVLGQLDPGATAEFIKRLASRDFLIRGRAELTPGDPPAIFDAAHNPDGARALAEALPGLTDGADIVCCLAVLEGKDAPGIVNALAPACSHFVCTEIPPDAIEGSGRPGGRARPALELAALCEKAGVGAEAVPDPVQAWQRARELAKERGGVALAAGSHYLLSCLWTERPAQSS